MAALDYRLEMGTSWLNLVATVYGRRRGERTDFIATPDQLADWLATVSLAPRRRPDTDDVAAAQRLREVLYAIARAVADDEPVPRAALRALNEALADDTTPRVTGGAGGIRASRPADTHQALGRLARQAADQLSSADRPRLRACSDDTCAGIFLDESGRRRWCNDARCGSRARVRAHRARAAGGPTWP